MAVKLLLVLSFVRLVYSGPQGLEIFKDPPSQREVQPWNDESLVYDPMEAPQPCDVPECSHPCQGAAPPRKCPTVNTTHCSTGCACITYCDALHSLICYETKHCERRRFFRGGRKRKTTKSLSGK